MKGQTRLDLAKLDLPDLGGVLTYLGQIGENGKAAVEGTYKVFSDNDFYGDVKEACIKDINSLSMAGMVSTFVLFYLLSLDRQVDIPNSLYLVSLPAFAVGYGVTKALSVGFGKLTEAFYKDEKGAGSSRNANNRKKL